MPPPTILQGLAEVAPDYDALLCDVWGVVHNGRTAFPLACDALTRFKTERGPVVLISNAPRPFADVLPQLDALGVPRAAWSAVVTSGDATRELLAKRAPGPAWAIGPERDAPLYKGLGLAFATPAEAAFIACTGPVDDTTETPEDYRERLREGAERGLDMICANPDRVVQRGDQLVYCGGALADVYAELGGAVIMAGKPHAPIYAAALAKAAELAHRPIARERLLAIGDGVATDIVGAVRQGLDALFIADGIHACEFATGDGRLDAREIERFLARDGGHARFAMRTLAWRP